MPIVTESKSAVVARGMAGPLKGPKGAALRNIIRTELFTELGSTAVITPAVAKAVYHELETVYGAQVPFTARKLLQETGTTGSLEAEVSEVFDGATGNDVISEGSFVKFMALSGVGGLSNGLDTGAVGGAVGAGARAAAGATAGAARGSGHAALGSGRAVAGVTGRAVSAGAGAVVGESKVLKRFVFAQIFKFGSAISTSSEYETFDADELADGAGQIASREDKVRAIFAQCDVDGDGELNAREFATAAAMLGFLCSAQDEYDEEEEEEEEKEGEGEQKKKKEKVKKKRLNARERGMMQKYLLRRVFRVSSPKQLDPVVLQNSFADADADRSGALDPAEFSEAMRLLGWTLSPYELKMIVDIFDEDGDGLIDYAEWSSFFLKDKLVVYGALEADKLAYKAKLALLNVVLNANGHADLREGLCKLYARHDKSKVKRVDELVHNYYLAKL